MRPALRLLRAIALSAACILLVAHHAAAQPANNDYYSDVDENLLRAVEGHHFEQGKEQMRIKRYAAAFDDFKFMLNYYPNHPGALAQMAELCSRWKSALCVADDFYARAIARNPKIALTYIVIGIQQYRDNQFDAAISSFSQALTIDPNSVNANYNIGLAYLEVHKYELANRHAQRAYAEGAVVPGLRDRLKRAGYWKPDAADAPGIEVAPASKPETSSALKQQ